MPNWAAHRVMAMDSNSVMRRTGTCIPLLRSRATSSSPVISGMRRSRIRHAVCPAEDFRTTASDGGRQPCGSLTPPEAIRANRGLAASSLESTATAPATTSLPSHLPPTGGFHDNSRVPACRRRPSRFSLWSASDLGDTDPINLAVAATVGASWGGTMRTAATLQLGSGALARDRAYRHRAEHRIRQRKRGARRCVSDCPHILICDEFDNINGPGGCVRQAIQRTIESSRRGRSLLQCFL